MRGIEKVDPKDALKVYIGYDTREDIAWQVCRHSLRRHAHRDVKVYPLKQATLREIGLYTRPIDASATTEFSLTRFLTPYVAATDGWSIFVDCDFLFTRDIYELLNELDPSKAVYVVQHDYSPSKVIKMDGKQQSNYPRKNWSSLMIFNGSNEHVRALTPSVINNSTPAFLHRFSWVPADSQIGALGIEWNFLQGEYQVPDQLPAAIHYTNGGPWFENCRNEDFSDLWNEERRLYESKFAG